MYIISIQSWLYMYLHVCNVHLFEAKRRSRYIFHMIDTFVLLYIRLTEEGWHRSFCIERPVALGCPNTDGTSLDCCTAGDASDVATTSSQGKGVTTSSTSERRCADRNGCGWWSRYQVEVVVVESCCCSSFSSFSQACLYFRRLKLKWWKVGLVKGLGVETERVPRVETERGMLGSL